MREPDEGDRAEPGDPVRVDADDVPPFTMCPHWVLLADLTPQAKVLWWALAAHVAWKEDGKVVWPSRATLAGILGVSRPQSVDRYLQELDDLGAIRVETRRVGRMKARNHYFVRFAQPASCDAPSSIAEFYRQKRAVRLGIGVHALFET